MSVGEKNALNFSNMTKRNSLDRCPSSGNDATSTRDRCDTTSLYHVKFSEKDFSACDLRVLSCYISV